MKFSRSFSALVAISCCLVGCSSEEQLADEELANEEPSYIYIFMRHETDRPKFDYAGYDEELDEWKSEFPDEQGNSEFELFVRRVPLEVLADDEEDWRVPRFTVVDFEETISRTGDDQFALNGQLKTKIPVIIQFCSMIQSGDETGNEFPELAFEAGKHDVKFEGTITGWWKDGAEEDNL